MSSIRIGHGLLLAVLLILCSIPATAADQQSETHFAPDAASVYQAASAIAVPAKPDVFVLESEETAAFDSEGKVVRTRYLLYKVLTQKGAQQWADLSYTWEPWHEERPAVRARVITPDNAVHPLDPATITDAPARETEDAVFSNRRVLRAPLPAIAPGSLVEQEEVSRETTVFFGAGSVQRYYFGFSAPLHHARLILEAPSAFPLHYTTELLPDLKPQRTESNGLVRLAFDVGPMEAFDDAEPGVPSDLPAFANITFSTGSSWQSVAEQYSQIVDKQIATDVNPLVAGLIAGKKSREEKAAAILQYLSREVRYTGVEFGDAAVIPRSPTETLTRKYGDCKDKASLLVALFRAAKIPAYIALLNVGSREDVAADRPGMGMFDHAIVYAPGSPDLWIDATDDYARLGQLPASDQGRLALIARTGTTSLLKIPESVSSDNLLVEQREIRLSENGPARITETSFPHGVIESPYRRSYVDKENKRVTDGLASYVKAQYLADKVDRIDRSDPADLSKQFQLVIECDKARRGSTDLDSAAAAIRFDTLFNRLPADLQEREKEEDTKQQAETGAKPKKKRITDYQLRDAFITEWQYTIVPPAGFKPKPLPQNVKLSLGPALLTEDFSATAEGVVHATIRFDSVKRRFTVAEAADLRNGVAQVRGGQPILIYFEPVGEVLLNEGKVREALQSYRDLITLHPTEAVHHLQLAQALLAAGMGDAARSEAQGAVKLEPKSALAQKTLAVILEYDRVGRRVRPGSDWAGARAALRAAEQLDPDDKSTVADLAILLEYDSWGARYSPDAPLKEAIAEYRKLTTEKLAELDLGNNLAFALFYDREFAEAEKNAKASNPPPVALIVACEGALNGAQAAISEARKRTAGEEQFKKMVKSAGDMLENLGIYSVAPDLLEIGASGDNASDIAADAATLRKARPHAQIVFPDDPAGSALRFYVLQSDPKLTLDQLRTATSRNGATGLATSDMLDQYVKSARGTFSDKARNGNFSDVGLDLALARAQPKVQGDDSTGYRVTLWSSAKYKTDFFLVKEDGKYRVLADTGSPGNDTGVGLEVLDRIAKNNLSGARTLLDWLRDDYHLSNGDDPLAGAPFARLWTKGKNADASTMKVAAAAILVEQKETAPQGIAILEAARTSSTNEIEKLNITLAILSGYGTLDDYEKSLTISRDLARQYPESIRAFYGVVFALRGLGRIKEAEQIAQERLQRLPGDLDTMRALAALASAREDYSAARAIQQKLVDEGKAEPQDLNGIAWNSLFTGKTDSSDLDAALKGAQLSNNATSILHTLGCVFAELGKTKEAREVLTESMDELDLDEPDDNYWYAFGRIAEQYGERDVALADYARVTKPKKDLEIPDSSYRLAQLRTAALNAQTPSRPKQK
ncbi:MAG TPA: DUF3857 domain-containing protein [Candidatus Dormibacteraeota bacterium]|nr:DUF3857 domain-containing protein [Candidatus Dormibacteraeota bacterium]